MGRFLGKLSSDAFGVVVDEMKIGHFQIPDAPAADADGILKDHALPAEAGAVTEFLAQPPVPMIITMVCSGTQTGKATVYGKNINDDPISEEFTLASATPVTGTKAFKSITSIELPVKVASETIDVGWGNGYGLPYCLTADELVILKLFNDAADSGNVTVDADEVEKNIFVPDGTPNGEKNIDLYIIV